MIFSIRLPSVVAAEGPSPARHKYSRTPTAVHDSLPACVLLQPQNPMCPVLRRPPLPQAPSRWPSLPSPLPQAPSPWFSQSCPTPLPPSFPSPFLRPHPPGTHSPAPLPLPLSLPQPSLPCPAPCPSPPPYPLPQSVTTPWSLLAALFHLSLAYRRFSAHWLSKERSPRWLCVPRVWHRCGRPRDYVSHISPLAKNGTRGISVHQLDAY